MIKKLIIRDWKSFDEATFHVDPLTILIGANASGKSNVLETFLFLTRIASNVPISQAINGDVNLPPIRGGFEWICRKPSNTFSIELTVEKSETQDYHYSLSCTVNDTQAEVFSESLVLETFPNNKKTVLFETAKKSHSPGLPTYFSPASQKHRKQIDLNRSHCVLAQAESLNIRKEVTEAVKILLGELQQICVFNPIPSHMRDYKPLSDTLQLDASNIAGVLAGLDSPRLEEVQTKLTRYLKDIPEKDIKRVWAETVGKFQSDAMLYCEEGWESESHIVDARGMSDGTLRYLAVITALLTRKENSLLIIEEIDNGLHPSRAKNLINMLKTLGQERNIDVVLTTHNPALLNALDNHMLPFITVAHRNDRTGSSLLTQLEDIEQLPKLMAGGTIGELSANGKIEKAVKQESGE